MWSTVTFANERWSLRKYETERLNDFQMWVWRRILKVSWMERVTNMEVLQSVNEERNLMRCIQWRQKNWIGHILRREFLLTEVFEGKFEGRRVGV